VEDEQLIGVIEMVNFSAALQRKDLKRLIRVLQLTPTAILAAEAFESQRQNLLNSVHRMTQLYDLEKSLNATLELDAVIEMIPMKVAGMLSCQAIHLWLFDGSVLRLMSSSGEDATVQLRMTQVVGEGYVADMAEEGEPLLITDPKDERLVSRNASLSGDQEAVPITTALVVPLMQDGAEVGVLEAVNKDVTPFDDDDEFFLTTIAETVSSALKNASLLFAERKLEILEALVHVSSEITSTLRLDSLLQIIVNSPQNVLPFEQCAIALDNRGKLQLKAVSGMSSLPLGDAHVEQVNDLIHWLSSQPEPLHLRQAAGSAAPDFPAEVARNFEASGYRALYSLPLMDDQGRVGLLLYESSDPDFLDLPHTEMIKIIAGQATVAIRNALLYREVPLMIPAGILAFVIFRSRLSALCRLVAQLWSKSSAGRRLWRPSHIVAAAVILILLFVPLWRDREDALFVVEPLHSITLHAAVPGRVDAVLVGEGEHVRSGQPLLHIQSAAVASLDAAASAQTGDARYQAFTAEVDGRSIGTAAAAENAAVQSTAFAREAQSSLTLASPSAGVVLTRDPEDLLRQNVASGESLITVAEDGRRAIRVYVPASGLDRIPRAQLGLALPGRFSILRMTLAPLGGGPVTLPDGLIARQDYKGIELPVFYSTRRSCQLRRIICPSGFPGTPRFSASVEASLNILKTAGVECLTSHLFLRRHLGMPPQGVHRRDPQFRQGDRIAKMSVSARRVCLLFNCACARPAKRNQRQILIQLA